MVDWAVGHRSLRLKIFVDFFGAKRASGFFQQAGEPDQNYGADKRHNDRPDDTAARPDSQHPEDPSAEDAAEDPENDVDDYAVTAALHHLACKPACDESNQNPSE